MPDPTPALPPGYRAAPATIQDISSIHRLVSACEREMHGQARTDPGGVAAVFARPGLILELDTLLIHDQAGRLAARAWVDRRSEVDVHPQHRGRGLGAALLDWAEARARRAGSEQIVQTVPDDHGDAVTLLRSRGYEPMVTEWLLQFAMPDEPTVLDLPETGEGYVEEVAVHRDHRDQGIARLLLRHVFRAFHRQGRRTCTLATHSDTGALALYLRVGMTVRHSSTVYRKGLRPAEDVARNADELSR
ncbi:GNAT family N-acetyltransferase [Streptomyces collinus]